MPATATVNVEYHLLENGIHRFDVYNASRQGVDDFFDLRDQMQPQMTEPVILLLISLNMPHLPSINHIMTRVRLFAQKYPRIQPIRTAVLYRSGMLVFVLNNFVKVFMRSRDGILFFKEGETEKATAWLLKRE